MDKFERPKLQSEIEAEKPILTLEELSKRLDIGKKEVKSVVLGGKRYDVPSPHAVENKLLELFARMDGRDDAGEQQEFLGIINEITSALKDVEKGLQHQEQHAAQSVKYPEASGWAENAEQQAIAAIRRAEDTLRALTLFTAEEKRKIRDIRREPTPPKENIAQPDEVLD